MGKVVSYVLSNSGLPFAFADEMSGLPKHQPNTGKAFWSFIWLHFQPWISMDLLQVGGIWRRVDTNCDGQVSQEVWFFSIRSEVFQPMVFFSAEEFLKFMSYKKTSPDPQIASLELCRPSCGSGPRVLRVLEPRLAPRGCKRPVQYTWPNLSKVKSDSFWFLFWGWKYINNWCGLPEFEPIILILNKMDLEAHVLSKGKVFPLPVVSSSWIFAFVLDLRDQMVAQRILTLGWKQLDHLEPSQRHCGWCVKTRFNYFPFSVRVPKRPPFGLSVVPKTTSKSSKLSQISNYILQTHLFQHQCTSPGVSVKRFCLWQHEHVPKCTRQLLICGQRTEVPQAMTCGYKAQVLRVQLVQKNSGTAGCDRKRRQVLRAKAQRTERALCLGLKTHPFFIFFPNEQKLREGLNLLVTVWLSIIYLSFQSLRLQDAKNHKQSYCQRNPDCNGNGLQAWADPQVAIARAAERARYCASGSVMAAFFFFFDWLMQPDATGWPHRYAGQRTWRAQHTGIPPTEGQLRTAQESTMWVTHIFFPRSPSMLTAPRVQMSWHWTLPKVRKKSKPFVFCHSSLFPDWQVLVKLPLMQCQLHQHLLQWRRGWQGHPPPWSCWGATLRQQFGQWTVQ